MMGYLRNRQNPYRVKYYTHADMPQKPAANCPNCGAPKEPQQCSYCKTVFQQQPKETA